MPDTRMTKKSKIKDLSNDSKLKRSKMAVANVNKLVKTVEKSNKRKSSKRKPHTRR